MSRSIPTINTHRLTLRPMRAEDFGRFAQIWAMPEVVEFIDGTPWPRSKSWAAFLKHAGHWQITGFGQWAVSRHRAPEMSGQAGFFFGKRDLGPDFDDFPEAFWALAPDAYGEGFGVEAARAAHDWFDRVVTGRLVCLIDARNARAVRIAEAMGYTPMRDVTYENREVTLYERNAPPQ